MIFPVKKPYRITTDFHEMRPLSKPVAKRDHPHGGWDIAVPVGTEILAPENGEVQWHFQFRRGSGYHNAVYWPYTQTQYAFRNYFYETFGGLCILYGDSGRTHVFAHIEASEILKWFRKTGAHDFYTEDQNGNGDAFYLFVNWRDCADVREGNIICHSGNAGFSTGPHIHYENHKGREWIRHAHRLDPATLWPNIPTP